MAHTTQSTSTQAPGRLADIDERMNMVDAEKAFADVQAFAARAYSLIKDMAEGSAPDASKEAQTRAAMAARSIVRNTPAVLRSLVRLEIAAEDLITALDGQRAELMDAVFGPDQT